MTPIKDDRTMFGTRMTLGVVLLVTVCSWPETSSSDHSPVQDYRQLTYPGLNEIRFPQIDRVTLSNGMRVFLLEDHELPLIRVSVRVRVGSIYEPADQIGLATITGAVMRSGGTTTWTGDEIDEELERIAASVETGIGLDAGWASVSVLREYVDTGLLILADVLMNPAFRTEKIRLAKMQIRGGISRRNDSPGQIASREFHKLIYGPDSIYARHAEHATVDSITREDLVVFHRRYYGPNNTMMAIWGDFTTAAMIEKLERVFAEWEKVAPQYPRRPRVDYDCSMRVYLIDRPGINQSTIQLGHIGGVMTNPDYFALTVMNRVLGDSFTGRLFRSVRSRRGLAYAVGGRYGMGYCHPGVFAIGCQTKSENTVQTLRAVIEEVCAIREREVADEELAMAKEGYLNSFIFNFDTAGEIVTRLMTYAYYGYPADFLQKTKEGIAKVTQADIRRVAQEYLRPEDIRILIVGQRGAFDESLSELGEVSEIDIEIPPPRP